MEFCGIAENSGHAHEKNCIKGKLVFLIHKWKKILSKPDFFYLNGMFPLLNSEIL